MSKIPFLLLGDGPAEPTGLGRIARDLAGLIAASDLPLDLVQVGGSVPPVWTGGWAHVPLERGEDWGAQNVQAIYRSIWGTRPGILFGVWDPSRLFTYTQIDLPVQKWCYTAIDGANVHDQISGPARVAMEQFDRVLAYNAYGATVLKNTLRRNIQYLPHGFNTATYGQATPGDLDYARDVFGAFATNRLVIGCVMTNQPRKDHSLLFESAAILLRRGWPIHVWLHTDVLVKDWAIPQLVEDFGLQKRVTITGGGQILSDAQLAALYQASVVTVLPSLGEGFGYPIVESLASGTPCIHSQCAGGEIYVPKLEWKVPVRERRIESVYGIVRPVMRPEDWANAIERAIKWRQAEGEAVSRAYCRGAVANLDWVHVTPRWRSWLKAGLQ